MTCSICDKTRSVIDYVLPGSRKTSLCITCAADIACYVKISQACKRPAFALIKEAFPGLVDKEQTVDGADLVDALTEILQKSRLLTIKEMYNGKHAETRGWADTEDHV